MVCRRQIDKGLLLAVVILLQILRTKPIPMRSTKSLKETIRQEAQGLMKRINKSSDQVSLDTLTLEKPTNHRRVYLKSKTGLFLHIAPSGKVQGNTLQTEYAEMEFQVINKRIKRIQSVSTKLYLGIARNGKVVAKKRSDEDTLFREEMLENLTYCYSSVKYPKNANISWYLSLKQARRSNIGKTQRASKTLPGDKSTQFFVIYK